MKPTKEKLFYFDAEWVPLAETPVKLLEKHPLLGESLMHQIDKWRRNATSETEKNESDQYWYEKKAHFYQNSVRLFVYHMDFSKKVDSKLNPFMGMMKKQ